MPSQDIKIFSKFQQITFNNTKEIQQITNKGGKFWLTFENQVMEFIALANKTLRKTYMVVAKVR